MHIELECVKQIWLWFSVLAVAMGLLTECEIGEI